jgi:hypothetical protein
MRSQSRWYRVGQAVGLWRMCVRQRAFLAGTGLWVLVGFVAFAGRQVAHDVQEIAEAET